MKYDIQVTQSEQDHIKNIIKDDYIKKYDESSFEKNYQTYLQMPEFSAMWSIYDSNNQLKPEYKDFNKGVHYIMRLVAQYHINQAMKAIKYDTLNDVNLSTDGWSNIGTPGRIAKVWAGDKLDNSTFSEFGDGRFVPSPRLAIFPVESVKKQGVFNKELKTFIVSPLEEYKVDYQLKWTTKVLKFTDGDTGQVYFADLFMLESDKQVEIEMFPDQEIVVKTIHNAGIGSTCSHHFLPFFITWDEDSRIVIAYKPYKYLLGISKITRVLEYCLNRPSLQEGSTELIHTLISEAVGTKDVFVGLHNLVHTCEFTRGSKKETTTTTEKAEGCFKDEDLRNNILRS